MNWQRRYELGDTPWDKGACSPVLLDLLKKEPNLFPPHIDVMVPGCGLGHDVRALASVCGSVMGCDISELAIRRAQEIGANGAEFRVLDIFEQPDGMGGSFDMVWEHTCFCAIPPSKRHTYVESMWQALKPNGIVLGVFFVDPHPKPEGPPFKLPREEVISYFAPHFILEWEREVEVTFPGREGQERLFMFRRLPQRQEE